VPPTHSLLGFAAVAFAIIIIPGPSVMFVVSRAVSFGRRAALLTVAGNAAGAYSQVLLVAVGIGAIVQRSIAVFTAVKLLGALYLIWLGIQTFRHRRDASRIDTTLVIARSRRSLVTDGFVVGASNPKTIVFFAAILPQFVEAGGAPEALQMAVLGMVFVAVALISDSVWGLGAGTARQWFVRSPRRLEMLSGAGGLVIVGLGIRLALLRHDD
jgi:threonine/homoserine/homoserine lactone efflux protein